MTYLNWQLTCHEITPEQRRCITLAETPLNICFPLKEKYLLRSCDFCLLASKPVARVRPGWKMAVKLQHRAFGPLHGHHPRRAALQRLCIGKKTPQFPATRFVQFTSWAASPALVLSKIALVFLVVVCLFWGGMQGGRLPWLFHCFRWCDLVYTKGKNFSNPFNSCC